MKTIITTLISVFIIATVPATTGQAFALEEEDYVDDIPFNTELIAYQALVSDMIETEIEDYVDDIPFNTKKIYYESLLNDLVLASEDERYVDDIPFCTREIYCMNRPCLIPRDSQMFGQRKGINNVPPVEYHTANFELSPRSNEIFRSIYNGHGFINYPLDSKSDNCKTTEFHIESLLAD